MARYKYCPDCGKRMESKPGSKMFCDTCRAAFSRATRQAKPDTERSLATRKVLCSTRWRRQMRPAIMLRDQYSCQAHQRIGVAKTGKSFPIDHIIPRHIAPDLVWEESNCECLCPECHNKKTKMEESGLVIDWRYERGKFVVSGGNPATRRRFLDLLGPHATLVMLASTNEECFSAAREHNARPIVLPAA